MATTAELIERAKKAVMTYNVNEAKAVANEAVADANVDLVELISNGYSAGITEVGNLFEQKKVFLPHIMAAAGALTAGMDIITPELERRGGSTGSMSSDRPWWMSSKRMCRQRWHYGPCKPGQYP